MVLFEHAETAITLKSKDTGTEATCECQFEIVGTLKFAERLIAGMSKKRIERNLENAKRLLEAG